MKNSKLVKLPPAATISTFIDYCLMAMQFKKDPAKKAKRRRILDNRILNPLMMLSRLLRNTQCRIQGNRGDSNGFGLKITGREFAFLSTTEIYELLICADAFEIVYGKGAYFYPNLSSARELKKVQQSEYGKLPIKHMLFWFEI